MKTTAEVLGVKELISRPMSSEATFRGPRLSLKLTLCFSPLSFSGYQRIPTWGNSVHWD